MSMSNSGGATGRSLNKGGSARVQGKQPGSEQGQEPAPKGHGSLGSGAVRPNGTMPAGLGGTGDFQPYRKSYATNKQPIKPTKTGGVR